MDNDFYVYEWYNTDTNEVFYVGKGRGYRYKNTKQRNRYFKNYYNKYNCNVRKVETNLLEEEAFSIEIELIKEYRKSGQCKCNITNGGEGATFPERSWNDLFRKMQYAYCVTGKINIMSNEEDYNPLNLKEKSLEELDELYEEYVDTWDGIHTLNILEIYDENENLNIGWECFNT